AESWSARSGGKPDEYAIGSPSEETTTACATFATRSAKFVTNQLRSCPLTGCLLSRRHPVTAPHLTCLRREPRCARGGRRAAGSRNGCVQSRPTGRVPAEPAAAGRAAAAPGAVVPAQTALDRHRSAMVCPEAAPPEAASRR